MVALNASVGLHGMNLPSDVRAVQMLLQRNAYRLVEGLAVAVDGHADPGTVAAIRSFQERVVLLSSPDGRVDPGGRTLRALNAWCPGRPTVASAPAAELVGVERLRFPLRSQPRASYKEGGRQFGARRTSKTGHRAHAGCDLLAPKGTEILAVADGEVIRERYYFYSGTYALEIRHSNGLVVRYGEIGEAAPGIRKGAPVMRGQVIAHVGRLDSGKSMLHLEMYRGTESGHLTDASRAPFQRRADLLDPTRFLDEAET